MIKTFIIDIFLVLAFYTLAISSGLKIFKVFKLNFSSKSEEFFFSIGLGLVIYSYLFLFLGFLGLLYRALFYGLVIAGLILCHSEVKYVFSETGKFIAKFFKWHWSKFARVLIILLAIAIPFNLLFNYAPLTDTDEIIYHISIPKIYVDSHKVIDIPDNFLSYFPLQIEMIYGYGIILRNGITAKLISYVLGILCMLLLFFFTRYLSNRETGILAATIFYLMPPIINASGIANIDIGYLFFSLLSVWGFMRLISTDSGKWLYLTVLMAGMSFASKLINAVLIFTLFIFITHYFLVKRKIKFSRYLGKFFISAVIIIFLFFPWFLRNYIYTGNPLPFFSFSFFGLNLPVNDMYKYHAQVNVSSFMSLSSFFGDIKMLFLGGHTVTSGPLIIAFGLPLLFFKKNKKLKMIMAFSALYFLLMFCLLPEAFKGTQRYYFLIYALFSILAAYGIEKAKVFLNSRSLINFLVLFPLVLPGLAFSLYFGGKRLPLFLGFQNRESYLKKEYGEIDSYGLLQYINNNIPPEARVLFIGRLYPMKYYYNVNVLAAQPHLMRMLYIKEVMAYLKSQNIQYIVFIKRNYQLIELANGKKTYKSKLDDALDLYWTIEDFVPRYFNPVYSESDKLYLYRVLD